MSEQLYIAGPAWADQSSSISSSNTPGLVEAMQASSDLSELTSSAVLADCQAGDGQMFAVCPLPPHLKQVGVLAFGSGSGFPFPLPRDCLLCRGLDSAAGVADHLGLDEDG